ncbi:MAG: hypothetical protein SGPRY_011710 [Prymnesium sp.]
MYQERPASYWQALLVDAGHFNQADLEGISAKQAHAIREALLVSSASQEGAVGALTQKVRQQEVDLKLSRSAEAVSRLELEMMAREMESKMRVDAHESEVLRIELTRAREEARSLREVREMWATATAQRFEAERTLDQGKLVANESLLRVRNELSGLFARLETELRRSLSQFRTEIMEKRFEGREGRLLREIHQLKRERHACDHHYQRLQEAKDRLAEKVKEDAISLETASLREQLQARKIVGLRRQIASTTLQLRAEFEESLKRSTVQSSSYSCGLLDQLQAEQARSEKLLHACTVATSERDRQKVQLAVLRRQRAQWQRQAQGMREALIRNMQLVAPAPAAEGASEDEGAYLARVEAACRMRARLLVSFAAAPRQITSDETLASEGSGAADSKENEESSESRDSASCSSSTNSFYSSIWRRDQTPIQACLSEAPKPTHSAYCSHSALSVSQQSLYTSQHATAAINAATAHACAAPAQKKASVHRVPSVPVLRPSSAEGRSTRISDEGRMHTNAQLVRPASASNCLRSTRCISTPSNVPNHSGFKWPRQTKTSPASRVSAERFFVPPQKSTVLASEGTAIWYLRDPTIASAQRGVVPRVRLP